MAPCQPPSSDWGFAKVEGRVFHLPLLSYTVPHRTLQQKQTAIQNASGRAQANQYISHRNRGDVWVES